MSYGTDESPFRSHASDVLTPPASGVICAKCLTQAYAGASFCRRCGVSLPTKANSKRPPLSSLKRTRDPAAKRKSRHLVGRKRSGRGGAVILVVTVLIALAGGLYWWFNR